MTANEKLEQKQQLLENIGKQLRENVDSNRHVDRELKALHKALYSEEPIDTVEIGKRIDALNEEMKTQRERLKELNVFRETPFEVPPEDLEYVLQEYPIPSPFLKFNFDTDLHVSNMFTVFDDEETQEQFSILTGGAFDEELTQHGHRGFVEAMFSDNFHEDIAFTVMNAFFWVLFFKGDSWLPVRSYTLEILRLIPKAILEQYPTPEDFIGAFSQFTRKTLASRGHLLTQGPSYLW